MPWKCLDPRCKDGLIKRPDGTVFYCKGCMAAEQKEARGFAPLEVFGKKSIRSLKDTSSA